MAKDVKFNIRLNIDGKEQIVTASTNVKQLANELGIAQSKTAKLRDSLLVFNQIGQSFQALSSSLQQLTGAMQQYTAAHRQQVESETKLANNMRNTMHATEEQIQAIKDYTAAQQKIGVVGDEVQMAGAQELAVHLKTTEALKQLIPIMNDLAVKQDGVKVSASTATSMASLLGKAMDGNTGALKRAGIVLTEYQEKMLKTGTEAERAAVLVEAVGAKVGGLNEEMAKTDTGRAQQMSNAIGDLKEQIGSLFSSVEPTIVAVAELGLALSALSTVGTSVAALTKAVTAFGVATKISTVATYAQTVAGKAMLVVNKAWAVSTRLLTQAQLAWTFSAKAAAIQSAALGIAIRGLMIATGVGAAIAAVTGIISLFASKSKEAADATDENTEAQERAKAAADSIKQAYIDTSSQLQLHIQKLKEFKGSKKEEQQIVTELNNTYGSTMGYFSSVAQWYKALVANSDAYCKQMVIEAQTRQLANQIAAEEEFRYNATHDEYGNTKRFSTAKEHLSVNIGGKLYDVEGMSQQEAVSEELTNSLRKQNVLQARMNKLRADGAKITMPVTGSPVAPTTSPKYSTKTGTGNKNTIDEKEKTAVEGSLDAYEEKLSDIRKQVFATADENAAKTLQATYKQVEAEYKAAKIRIGIEEPEKEEVKTFIDRLREQLDAANKVFDDAVTREARAEASANVENIQAKINEATNGKLRIAADVEPSYIKSGSLTDKRQSYTNAQSIAGRIQQDYEISLIGKDEALRQILELNAELFKMGLKPIQIGVETEDVDKAEEKFDATTEAIGQMGSAFNNMGSSLELPELNVAGTIAQAIATMAQGYATATAQAAELGPIAWVAFAAAGLAQLAAIISSVKGMTAFAQGGIVSGPTMALVGEYAGASNNPEVIAPLDRLRSLIRPSAGVGNVRFVLEGRQLVGVIENTTRISSKSGRRSNIA